MGTRRDDDDDPPRRSRRRDDDDDYDDRPRSRRNDDDEYDDPPRRPRRYYDDDYDDRPRRRPRRRRASGGVNVGKVIAVVVGCMAAVGVVVAIVLALSGSGLGGGSMTDSDYEAISEKCRLTFSNLPWPRRSDAESVSLVKCKLALDSERAPMSDSEIRFVRDQLYVLAEILVDGYAGRTP